MTFLLGFFAAAFISITAYHLSSLNRSGAYAATLIGTIIMGIGGWKWAILLMTFFISSTVLTKSFADRKQGAGEKFAKGGQRDAGQVFGNGGIPALFVLLAAGFPAAIWPWLGFAAALAAVNADTWATELGVLDSHQPRLLTDLHRAVEKGTSGAVSTAGSLAALAGAATIGALATILSPNGPNIGTLFLVTLAGLLGAFLDSYLGATVQAMYFCPKCQKETERHPIHSCASKTTHLRGWRWLNNDWVNLVCAAGGSVFALMLWIVL